MSEQRYAAFISYSHRDGEWGTWLHRSLERYRMPGRLVKQGYPRRLGRVFRDREELPTSSDLGAQIEDALRASGALIVICSPRSAQSHWVNEEVASFKRMGRSNRVLCLIVDGEPGATDGQECLCPALRVHYDDEGTPTGAPAEPIAADARPQGDDKLHAKLKLIAGLVGIGFDDLVQREQRRRQARLRTIVAASLLLSLTLGGLSLFAFQQRGEAQKQTGIAQENEATSRRRLIASHVERGWRERADGDVGAGLLWHVEALALADEAGWEEEAAIHRMRVRLQAGRMPSDIRLMEETVAHAVFNADGTRFIGSASPDLGSFVAAAFDAETGRRIATGPEHRDSWVGAGYLADGLVVTADSSGAFFIWKESTGEIVHTLNHGRHTVAIDVHAGGQRLLTAGATFVQEWDVKTGRPLGISHMTQADVIGASYALDDKRVVTIDQKMSIRVFASPTSSKLAEQALTKGVAGVKWRSARFDGGYIVAVGRHVGGQVVRRWKLRDLSKVEALPFSAREPANAHDWLLPHGDRAGMAGLTADKSLGVTGGYFASGSMIVRAPPPADATFGTFDAQGKRAALRMNDGRVALWSMDPLKMVVDTAGPAVSPHTLEPGFTFPDDVHVALLLEAGLWVWNTSSGDSRTHTLPGAYVAPLTKGRLQLHTQKEVLVYDTVSGETLFAFASPDPWRAVASANGTHLAVRTPGGVQVYDARTGAALGPTHALAADVKKTGLGTDGTRLATWRNGGPLVLLDTENGAEILRREVVQGADFASGQPRMIILDSLHTVEVLDTRDGRVVGPPLVHSDAMSRAAFDGSGKRLATCSYYRGRARIWDVERGAAIFARELAAPVFLEFVGDGALLRLGGVDRIDLFDVATGLLVTAPDPATVGSAVADVRADGSMLVRYPPYLLRRDDPSPSLEALRAYAQLTSGRRVVDAGLLPLSEEERAELATR